MKKICFTLFCLCLLACQRKDIVFTNYKAGKLLVIEGDTLLSISTSFDYPIASFPDSRQKKLQGIIISNVFGKPYTGFGRNAASKYVKQAYSTFKKESNKEILCLRFDEQISTNITWLNDSLIEYSVVQISSTQNAQTITINKNLIIDLEKSQILDYDCIFKASKEEYLRDLLWLEIQKEIKDTSLFDNYLVIKIINHNLINNFFKIKPRGIEFILNPYESFSDVHEPLKLFLPIEKVYPILNKGTSVWYYYNKLLNN